MGGRLVVFLSGLQHSFVESLFCLGNSWKFRFSLKEVSHKLLVFISTCVPALLPLCIATFLWHIRIRCSGTYNFCVPILGHVLCAMHSTFDVIYDTVCEWIWCMDIWHAFLFVQCFVCFGDSTLWLLISLVALVLRTKTTQRLEGGRDWLHCLATRILRAVHISIFHFYRMSCTIAACSLTFSSVTSSPSSVGKSPEVPRFDFFKHHVWGISCRKCTPQTQNNATITSSVSKEMLEHKQRRQRTFFSSSLGSWFGLARGLWFLCGRSIYWLPVRVWIFGSASRSIQIFENKMFSETHRVWMWISDPINKWEEVTSRS